MSESCRAFPLERHREVGTGSPRHADRHDTRSLAQAAAAPLTREDLARYARRAEALRHAVDVVALEAVGRIPFIAAEAFAPIGAVGSLEAIDALAVLVPLQHP